MPGAEACVPTQELAREVEQRLARPVFVSASQADVSIEGRIEHRASPNRWHATIILRDAAGATLGTRELERPETTCDGMREPLALVIAVMIDPDAALAHKSDPQPPPPPPEARPEPATTASAAPPAAPPPIEIPTKPEPRPAPDSPKPAKHPEPWFFEASAAVFGAAGMTPSSVLGLGVTSVIEAPKIPIALDGAAAIFFDSTANAGSSDGRSASTAFTLAYLGGGLCPLRARGERLHVLGCLISQLGLLRARSQGFSSSEDKLAVLYNIGVEGRASLRIAGPFALRAGLSGVVPLVRSPFAFARGDGTSATLFQVAPVAMTGDVGLGFEFP